MTKFAELIALREGGWKLENGTLVGVPGTIPFDRDNPGDLRHSPNSRHPGDPNAIGSIDTQAEGWADLERQLQLYASRGMNLRQAIYDWAPPNENDTESYLAFVLAGLGGAVDENTPLSEVLEIPA